MKLSSTVLAAVTTVAALMSGCAVGPDYHTVTPQQEFPQHFGKDSHPKSEVPDSVEWWRVFGDKGLDALVDAALHKNVDITSAEANIRLARANLGQISSARSIQVNGIGRYSRDQLSKDGEEFANVPFPNPITSFTDYRAGLDASWEIDLFGHTARGIQAAQANVDVAQAQCEDVSLSVSAETARNVLDYRFFQQRVANTLLTIEYNQKLLHLVDLQRQAGLASDIDVKQIEVGLRNAESALPGLRYGAESVKAALIPLTGLTEQQIAQQLSQSDDVPATLTASQFAVESTVLERRPDVRIAERKLAVATANVGVAVADQYPRFTLLGDAGWDSIHPGTFGQQASRYWNFGPQISIPLLNGGKVQAEIASSEAERDGALANYRKSVLNALADTESAMLRCQGDDGKIKKLESALLVQSEQIVLTLTRVNVGEAPQADLLNAQLLQAQLTDQKIAQQQFFAEDLVLLYKSLGGSTTKRNQESD